MKTFIAIIIIGILIITARIWVPFVIGLIGLALFVLGASVVGGMFVAALFWPLASYETQVVAAAIIDFLAILLGAAMMLYASNIIYKLVKG